MGTPMMSQLSMYKNGNIDEDSKTKVSTTITTIEFQIFHYVKILSLIIFLCNMHWLFKFHLNTMVDLGFEKFYYRLSFTTQKLFEKLWFNILWLNHSQDTWLGCVTIFVTFSSSVVDMFFTWMVIRLDIINWSLSSIFKGMSKLNPSYF